MTCIICDQPITRTRRSRPYKTCSPGCDKTLRNRNMARMMRRKTGTYVPSAAVRTATASSTLPEQ